MLDMIHAAVDEGSFDRDTMLTVLPKLNKDPSLCGNYRPLSPHNSADNLRRPLHAIYFSKDIESPCAVLSLDAEKAFDRLEWNYL